MQMKAIKNGKNSFNLLNLSLEVVITMRSQLANMEDASP